MRELLCVLYDLPMPAMNVSVRDALLAASAERLAEMRAHAQAPLAAYSEDPRDQATPRGMLESLRRLFQADGISPAARDTLLPIMRRTSTGLRRIEGRLPPGCTVANKTGSACGTANDVGFVTLPGNGGTLVLAIFVKASPLPAAAREDVIAELARTAVDACLMAA